MKHEHESSGPILRVFEARAKPGRADDLAQKFATTSADVVRTQPGNGGYFFGPGIEDENVLVFASIWSDMNAVKNRFGADWRNSYLPPGYDDLIEACSVRHYDLASGWRVTNLSSAEAG